MVRCPSCQTENVDGAAFCDNCGKSLSVPSIVAPAVAGSALQPVMPVRAAAVTCQSCGTLAIAGDAYCSNCGNSLPAAAMSGRMPAPQPVVAPLGPAASAVPPTAPVTPPKVFPTMPVAPPVPAAQPYFVVVATGARLNLGANSEVLVGRVDPVSGVFPDVDLTSHGGDEGGVSRRHLKITLAGNQYFVQDMNSTNGSWIGQNRVQPGARVPLNNGDQLRLGRVLLNFFTG
jgi:hypothetical protein